MASTSPNALEDEYWLHNVIRVARRAAPLGTAVRVQPLGGYPRPISHEPPTSPSKLKRTLENSERRSVGDLSACRLRRHGDLRI